MPRGFVCVVTVLLVLLVVVGGGWGRGGIPRRTWWVFFRPLCVGEPGMAQGRN